jgi:MFS superfamily sulfate permease-like transporter
MNSITTNLRSGIVVFLVALPLCLGIALACNVPLFSGLLAGIIGGLVVCAISGSVLSVSGPAAGLTSIVITSVAALESFEAFTAAVLVGGVLQLILGVVRAGSIGNYVPNAVIKGMLAGIGIILIMKQIPHLVGYDVDPEGDFDFSRSDGRNTLSDLYQMLNNITPGAVIVGVVSLLIIMIGRLKFYKNDRILSNIPPALLVVIVGVLLQVSLEGTRYSLTPEHLVRLPVIRDASDMRSAIILPDFSLWTTTQFWSIAFTLAIVASLETLLSIEAADKLDPKKRESDSNRELLAQGAGNIVCGLVGALPVTAVIVRTSANITAGATSKLSAVFHAVLLLISVLFIPNVLMMIPNSSLAAILIYTGYKLCAPELFNAHYRKGLDQFLPFIVTIVVMLVTDLLKGVGAGLVVSVIFIIRSSVKASFEIMQDTVDGKTLHLLKLPQHATFFNKGYMINYLKTIGSDCKVIIDGTINKSIDKDVLEVMQEFDQKSAEKNISIQYVKFNLPKESKI